jgi:hypothetical protein
MRAVARNVMHLDPAPGLGQPFLNEHGQVCSDRRIKKAAANHVRNKNRFHRPWQAIFRLPMESGYIIYIFTSEILSIFRVFAAANIVGYFVYLYDRIEHSTKVGGSESPSPVGFADTARKENYFCIFERNSGELGTVDPSAVNDVTAFYAFLRAARDATRSIQLWKNPDYNSETMKADIIGVILFVFPLGGAWTNSTR